MIPVFFFTIRQQLRHCFSKLWVKARTGYFRKGQEDKEPLGHPGMGDGQLFGVQRQIVVEEDIEIQGPVLEPHSLGIAHPAVSGFDALQTFEQLMRRQPGADKADRVDKPVLTVHAHRLASAWR